MVWNRNLALQLLTGQVTSSAWANCLPTLHWLHAQVLYCVEYRNVQRFPPGLGSRHPNGHHLLAQPHVLPSDSASDLPYSPQVRRKFLPKIRALAHWATWKHLDDQLDLLTSVLNLPKSVFILIDGPPISSPPRNFWQSRMEKLIRQALDKAMDKDPAAHLFRGQKLRISCESEEISRNPMPFWIAGCLAVRVCLF